MGDRIPYIQVGNDLPVNWGSDLTALADSLLKDLTNTVCDPFKKHCIVVNSSATEKWLKQYFLLDRKISQVLLNIDFVKLPELVNDWLFAVTEGKSPQQRRANQHPYSKSVMTWRIYRILEQAQPDGAFAELLNYINNGNGNIAKRRGALAEKLAKLYDDYLNYRFRMLRGWETGKNYVKNVPNWQIELYKQLVNENKMTYARQYDQALNGDRDGSREAYAHGFPEYLSIHVFDIPFIPEPSLHILEKIAKTVPVKFWVFNPQDDWIADTPSATEVKRELRKKIKKELERHQKFADGEIDSNDSVLDLTDLDYRTEEERLLGEMASGIRGVIGTLCNDYDGNVEVVTKGELGSASDSAMDMKNVSISIHSTYSPRRELEAIKDGLHNFFASHKDVALHEALVLCADWERYAPLIDMVFPRSTNSGEISQGYIPVVTESIPGSSIILQSFENLLKFRSNRFEISAVFSLLDVADISARRGLYEDAVDALRKMTKDANIHWGANDENVIDSLGISSDSGDNKKPFTWQRGFDRLVAELLHGFDADDLMKDAGGSIGKLHPCGRVESDRADYVAALWSFFNDLTTLRQEKLPQTGSGKINDIREAMLWVLDTFYDESDNNIAALNGIRKAIGTIAENMTNAGIKEIDYDVFIDAVLNSLDSHIPGRKSNNDSVLFAPLNCYTATPHKFIWICGLNDGVFPCSEARAAYDVIGRYPDIFDASRREQDAFALLKAMLVTKPGGQLSFSYVGRSNRNNQPIPPSVLLEDLICYFNRRNIGITCYEHPLTGYSRRYFSATAGVPQSYSGIYLGIADLLAAPKKVAGGNSFVAFPPAESDDTTEIELDDLVTFFTSPNNYLFKERLNANIPWLNRFNDSECLEAKLDKTLKKELILKKVDEKIAKELSVETGNAADETAAENAIKDLLAKVEKQTIEFTKGKGKNKEVLYSCIDANGEARNFAETYMQQLQNPEIDATVNLKVNNRKFRIKFKYRTIMLTPSGRNTQSAHSIWFFDSLKENELRIRHLAVNAISDDLRVTTLAFSSDVSSPKTKNCCLPLSVDSARESLSKLLALATEQLPEGYPDFGNTAPKEDKIPEKWQKILSDAVDLIEG